MLFYRRIPGFVYNHKCGIFSIILCIFLFIYTLYKWHIICFDSEPWELLKSLCNSYMNGHSSGDLCSSLCTKDAITSVSCEAFHAGKDLVFSASLKDGKKIIIKSTQNLESLEVLSWSGTEGVYYPTEEIFTEMVHHRIKSRLNMSLKLEDIKSLTSSALHSKKKIDRHLRMNEMWHLLQDNEYLLSRIYHHREIFPKILGNCGTYFGVEYLNPILEESKIFLPESHDLWKKRVHLSLLLLNLIDKIDSEGLLLCDVKPSHFGISKLGKLKVLDLDVTFSKSVADAITNTKKNCNSNSDCNFFDCRSHCNEVNKICDSPVVTTNRQIVCEKILLGWTLPGKLIVPGLLMSSLTPPAITSLLRQCAEGNDIENRLYHILEGIHAQLQGIEME